MKVGFEPQKIRIFTLYSMHYWKLQNVRSFFKDLTKGKKKEKKK